MEEDLTAIRETLELIQRSLSRCEWSLYVLVHSLTIFVGIYLFRLALFAKDRFGKKILGLVLACLVGSEGFAASCPEDERAIPVDATDGNSTPLPAGPWDWTCIEASSKTMTGQAGDCSLIPGQPYRFLKVVLRGHKNGAPNTNDDVEFVFVCYVHQINNDEDAIVVTQDYSRKWGSNDPLKGTSGGPDPEECKCPTCSSKCIFAAVLDYYRSGTGPAWPPGRSITDQYEVLQLAGCGPPPKDSDGDGIPDDQDTDDDNDGIPDDQDPDDDGDGIPDGMDPDQDSDGDGIPDPQDNDDDGDGIPDEKDGDEDDDGDGIPNPDDGDDDGDGIPDENDEDNDDDGDGIPNPTDPDDDGDGTPDENDPDHPNGPDDPPPGDSDGDGVPDETDPDDDGDGIPDEEDPDHPDFEDENPDSTGCEDWSFVSVFRLIGRQVLGLNNGLLEENAASWQDASGNGVEIPYVELDEFVSGNKSVKYMTLNSSGVVTWNSGSYTIPGWNTAASVVRIGLSAILVVWFARVAVSMIGGLD